jgi:hypothetical protein
VRRFAVFGCLIHEWASLLNDSATVDLSMSETLEIVIRYGRLGVIIRPCSSRALRWAAYQRQVGRLAVELFGSWRRTGDANVSLPTLALGPADWGDRMAGEMWYIATVQAGWTGRTAAAAAQVVEVDPPGAAGWSHSASGSTEAASR